MTSSPRRILVVNPNSNPQVTDNIRRAAERLARPGLVIEVTHPPEAPFAIEALADRRAVEPSVLAMLEQAHLAGAAGFVMACFDDIAVAPARRIVDGPVLDACEGGLVAAQRLGGRVAIVTTFPEAVARIESLVRRHDATHVCSVLAAGVTVADAASGAGRERLLETIRLALGRDGADAVILGSGGLTGQAEELARLAGAPVIDGVEAAIALCAERLDDIESREDALRSP